MSHFFALYTLRILHIVVGVFWVGTVVFMAAFLTPSVRAAGPGGGAVFQQLMGVRRLPLWIMGAMVVTLLSGLGLYWRDSAGFQSAWLASGPGKVFGLGGAVAIGASILGLAVNMRAGRRLAEITGRLQSAGRPPTPDEQATLAALQARLGRASVVAAVLLVIAMLLMAIARYVP
jgi:uncharacterized membrane protein